VKYVINLWFVLATLIFYAPQPGHEPISDLFELFFSGESVKGEVLRCDEKQFRFFDHLPVAVSPNGIEALGSFRLGESWCRRQVGKSVDIILHPNDLTRSRISSYIQLWALPVHVFVTLLLILASKFRPKVWQYIPAPYVCGLLVFWIAEYYF